MTKARDLANIISGGFTESDIPNLSASKITSGTFADARIADLNASKLTGSIADARIPASAVSQHATTFDDNDIINDLSTVALRSATTENAIAYNTNSSFIDVFQDSSAIGSFTTAVRNSSEYVSAQGELFGSEVQYPWATSNVSMTTAAWSSNNHTVNASTTTGYGSDWWNIDAQNRGANNVHSAGANASSVKYDFGASYKFSKLLIGKRLQHGDFRYGQIDKSDDGSTWTGVDFTNWAGSNTGGNNVYGNGSYFGSGSTPNPTGLMSTMSSSGAIEWLRFTTGASSSNTGEDSLKQFITGFTAFNARYLRITLGTTQWTQAVNSNASLSSFGWYYKPFVSSASSTGNFISNVITASSSKSKMGAIITYQDQVGTNTLNTDIVLQLSADNGSNFATATLSALPNYSTGIKMAKVNDLAVTAGTQLKYKISFANQSASKEARIRGVSLQY